MAEARSNTKPKTRRDSSCSIFGAPAELSPTMLPTYADLMKYFMLVRDQIKPRDIAKEPSVSDVSVQVAQKVEELWRKASIPHISHQRILERIKTYHGKYRALLSHSKDDRTKHHTMKRLQTS